MRPLLIIKVPPGRENVRGYAVRLLFEERLGLTAHIEHGTPGRVEVRVVGADGVVVLPDLFLGMDEEQWLSPGSMPAGVLQEIDPVAAGLDARVTSPTVPVLFGDERVTSTEGRIEFGADLIGGCFFLLSRYEEYVILERDVHGRFPASASTSLRLGFLDRPLADEYIELLRAAVLRIWPRLKLREPVFRIVPTHDVDVPFRYAFEGPVRSFKQAARDLLVERSPQQAFGRLSSWSRVHLGDRAADPNNRFALAMEESERRGMRSEFNFIADTTDPKFEGSYRIDHPWIVDLLAKISERGHGIGLHGSYGSYRSADQLDRERCRLHSACERAGVEAEVESIRQHYLRMDVASTFECQERAGLRFDSTLGFSDTPGFRCGTCHEFTLFSIAADRAIAVKEQPLIVMDDALGLTRGVPTDEATQRLVELKRRCRIVRGQFVVLWHNTALMDGDLLSVYRAGLDA